MIYGSSIATSRATISCLVPGKMKGARQAATERLIGLPRLETLGVLR